MLYVGSGVYNIIALPCPPAILCFSGQVFFGCFLGAAAAALAACLGSVRLLRHGRRRGWGKRFAVAFLAGVTLLLTGKN